MKLTKQEKDLVLEALEYYKVDTTHGDKIKGNGEYCGLNPKWTKIMNNAIAKIKDLT